MGCSFEPMKKINLNINALLSTTQIVGVISSKDDLEYALKNPDLAYMLECRLDCFEPNMADLKKLKRHGLIMTARHPNEGGKNPELVSSSVRIRTLERYSSLAMLVDIEAASIMESKDMRDFGRSVIRSGRGLIVSHHDFDGVGTLSSLEHASRICESIGGQVLKLAVTPDTFGELVRFIKHVDRIRSRSSRWFSAMAMGEYGAVSRLFFASAGSSLVYGRLRNEGVVAGQMSVSDLAYFLKTIS